MQYAGTISPPVLNFTSVKLPRIFNSRVPVLLSEGRANDVAFYDHVRKRQHNLSVLSVCARRLSRHRKSVTYITAASSGGEGSVSELDDNVRKLVQALLWTAEGIYIGDPVWAISSETINELIGLSLNFFFILPLTNIGNIILQVRCKILFPLLISNLSVDTYISCHYIIILRIAGFHLIEAPVLHPMSEGLFNFVIGWTVMFSPLLYTDKRRDRFKGSLDVLWGFQMFLTNTFLIPYMALRLNKADTENTPKSTSQLGSVMTKGAAAVGLISGLVCFFSILWALYGCADGDFGDLRARWEFVLGYLASERLAYAFIWDICLYVVFQPWLIGDNLQNLEKDKIDLVKFLRFIPVVGMIAYCLFLKVDKEK
ncbi:outer membrane protein P1 [Striga asiatica]|uniref:Outer membrane protein P1 n=1 Tax=Striga asiatica TaxID=4170 RepID=A0A5A7QAD1_STRAF|nr:outer membrane protein P1 [Striga asiatica]